MCNSAGLISWALTVTCGAVLEGYDKTNENDGVHAGENAYAKNAVKHRMAKMTMNINGG